jgi:hypothetical protein
MAFKFIPCEIPKKGNGTRSKSLLLVLNGVIYMFLLPENLEVNYRYLRRICGINPRRVKDVPSILGGVVPGFVSPLALFLQGVDAKSFVVMIHPFMLEREFAWHVHPFTDESKCTKLTGKQIIELCNESGASDVQIVPLDQVICEYKGCKTLPTTGRCLCDKHNYCTNDECMEILDEGPHQCKKH